MKENQPHKELFKEKRWPVEKGERSRGFHRVPLAKGPGQRGENRPRKRHPTKKLL